MGTLITIIIGATIVAIPCAIACIHLGLWGMPITIAAAILYASLVTQVI